MAGWHGHRGAARWAIPHSPGRNQVGVVAGHAAHVVFLKEALDVPCCLDRRAHVLHDLSMLVVSWLCKHCAAIYFQSTHLDCAWCTPPPALEDPAGGSRAQLWTRNDKMQRLGEPHVPCTFGNGGTRPGLDLVVGALTL